MHRNRGCRHYPLIPKPIGLTVLHKEQEGDGSKSSHIENIPPVLFDLVEQAVTEQQLPKELDGWSTTRNEGEHGICTRKGNKATYVWIIP